VDGRLGEKFQFSKKDTKVEREKEKEKERERKKSSPLHAN